MLGAGIDYYISQNAPSTPSHLAINGKQAWSKVSPSDTTNLPETAPSESEPHLPKNKILYVVGSLDIGGTERHLVLIAPRIKRMGWDPVIYCLTRPGQQANEVKQAGVPVISAPFPIASGQGWLI